VSHDVRERFPGLVAMGLAQWFATHMSAVAQETSAQIGGMEAPIRNVATAILDGSTANDAEDSHRRGRP
jgi:hypothetical protein